MTLEPQTLVELLRLRARAQPEQLAYTFLADGEAEESRLNYAEMDREARAIAAWLQSFMSPGERALLIYPPGLEYIAAFFGCLYAGVVAVPAYPPRRNRNLLRLQAILADAQACVALTLDSILSKLSPLLAQTPNFQSVRWLATDKVAKGLEHDWREPTPDADALAFLQYTSGSTSTPKGVMLSHRNLLHNERIIRRVFRQSEQSHIFGWLPLYHDMGLIGNVIQPLFVGAPCTLMSPAAFLQRPFRWLQGISRYRATTSGGPNFAYDLCIRKISAEERETLDLSSWRVAYNGSEPIRAETLEKFAETFAPCGFRRDSFYPCYGLAESTLIVSGRLNATAPVIRSVSASALEKNLVEEASAAAADDAKILVGCGESPQGQRIIIADQKTLTECRPGQIGEVWVAGESVAQGYWNRAAQTAETFGARLSDTGEGEFLRTGDLGFLLDGELFITGRLKDLIIIRGLNHYPQDIEETLAKCHPAARPGGGAAFSVEASGEERLVVVQEVNHHQQKFDADAIIHSIREAVAREHEIHAYAIVLIRAGAIPKTSSGKIQRHACRQAFLERSFEAIAEWQASVPPESENPVAFSAGSEAEIEGWLQSQIAFKVGLEAKQIDVGQPVMRYGLDSLAAVELVHNIENSLGVTLPLHTFLHDSSVAEVAAGLFQALHNGASQTKLRLALTDQTAATEHPLSHGQDALWFLHQMSPESTAYNLVGAVSIRSELDVNALEVAFRQLIERHPALRTSFRMLDGKPLQHVHQHVEFGIQNEDASGLSESQLKGRLKEIASRPFDLQQAPLLRVNLLRRSARVYVLVLAVHHIVADLWSLGVLIHELGELYHAAHNGTRPALPALSFRYSDYVRWQNEMLASAEGERLWNYWQQQLGGELPVLNLPVDRPRPALQSYRGASHSFQLSGALTESLKSLSRQRGATLFMSLLTAFQALLARYTGQTEITVGSPTAGRNHAGLAGLIGYFVNPVVVRTDLSGSPSFDELLPIVRRTLLDAFEHQDFPFAVLVERLQPVRDPSRSPLFQVMFVLQKAHVRQESELASFALGRSGARLELSGLRLESLALEQQVAQFDLTLVMAEVEDGLAASIQYNTDIFEAATMQRLAGHFVRLLEGITSAPPQPLKLLPLLTPEETHQLLWEWNDTEINYAPEQLIHELFEAQARRTPEATALIFQERRVSYQELNGQANQLAHRLRHLGVEADTLVGVCMERSIEMVVGLLAVLKAGGAYVPLDPAYPHERLTLMLEDARPRVLLTQTKLAAHLPACGASVVAVDGAGEELARASVNNPPRNVNEQNLAYVIYTSGSTGLPKGAMNSHAGLRNRLLWMQDAYRLSEADRVLQKTPFTFDVSVWEFFWPLMAGACLVVAEPGGHQDSSYLVELIKAQRITTLHFVPSMLQAFLEESGLEECRRLRRVICSGEALRPETQERFFSRLNAELHNLYGPTEASIDVTFWQCRPDAETRSVPIGKPIANMQTYVLDDELKPVPVGVAGELYLGGVGLARGYLNRPELTARRFIPHPFSRHPGERLYRTGDVARYLPDGNIEFLGRVDHQVKVRGFRVELGEIETTLARHPAVREAVVIAHGDASGNKRLVAYLVAGEPRPATSEWRAYLKEHLPEYMIPSAFILLDKLPLNANGKLDRRSLPPPEWTRPDAERSFHAPRNHIEETLANIWARVLGVEKISVHDNFFELGGDSILSLQIVARANQAGLRLKPHQMLQHQTIAELARVAESGSVAAAEQGTVTGIVPLTPIQHVFFAKATGNPHHFNQAVMLETHPALDPSLLERALNHLHIQHDALRLRFTRAADGWQQQNAEREERSVLTRVALPDPGDGADASAMNEWVAATQKSLSIDEGPLVGAALFSRGENSPGRLLLVIHHLAVDAVSWRILLEDLQAAYAQLSAGEEVDLGLKTTSFKQWAEELQRYSKAEECASQLDYWLDVKCRRVAPARGGEHAGVVNTYATERSVSVELGSAETQTLLQEIPAAYRTQINEVLLAALLRGYALWSGEQQLLLDVEGHGRENIAESLDLSRTVGWFTSLTPVLLELNGAATPLATLQQVKEQLRLIPQRGIGYGVLRYLSDSDTAEKLRDLSQAEICFNYLGQLPQLGQDGGWFSLTNESCGPCQSLQAERHYLIDIVGSVSESRLQFKFLYSENLHQRAAIEQFAGEFVNTLRQLIANPRAQTSAALTPSDFPLTKLDQDKLDRLASLLGK